MMQNNNITPEMEDQMINQAYQNLLNIYLSSNHRKKVEIIDKAFKFARDAHKGIRRRSGEPYIMHPIAVATIVIQEIGLGSTSISAALLHDVVEDTDYTVEDIEAQFGHKIARIVDGTCASCSSRWPTACTTCAPCSLCPPTSSTRLPVRRSTSMPRWPTAWVCMPSRPSLKTSVSNTTIPPSTSASAA